MMHDMKNPIVLIDASSYFFRAFHALPPLTNSKGQPTGAIFGVANMVRRLMKDYQTPHIIVIFDAKGKTFRDTLYPEYKATRPPMPEELKSQFEPLLAVLKAMGLPVLMESGVEADDVIATLARKAEHRQQHVIISTGDKDLAQLVSPHITLINTMTNTTLDEQGVFEKFGVKPNQIVDYLVLIGDKVDNIPGVAQCGAKTAVKWLNQYETLDNLIAHLDEISGKIGENLKQQASFLPLAKKLVTLTSDLNLPCNLDDLVCRPQDTEALIELTQTLEFKNWLKELLSNTESHQASRSIDSNTYTIIQHEVEFKQLCNALNHTASFCIDTETTHLNPHDAKLVGIAIAMDINQSFYIPLTHQNTHPMLDIHEVLSALKPILENPNIGKIGHNLKYDFQIFKNEKITLQGIIADTMLESYILNSSANRHDMDSLALKYLGYQTITFEEVAGKGTKQVTFDRVPLEKAAPYAAEDADITLKLHKKFTELLDEPLQQVLKSIEIPLLTVLANMEYQGVLIDVHALKIQGERLKERIKTLQSEAFLIADKTFNLNSTQQLQTLLFEELKLPVISKTPKGQPSTAESVLQDLAYDYPLPKIILEYRSLTKLVSTYIDALPRAINAQTGRVHTSYNQAIAATGRLSSSDPNLQNIPIRRDEGRMIRRAFIAPDDHYLVAVDYSQIELRIMAHCSQDPNLLDAFANHQDIHTRTASEMFNLPIEAVDSEHRRRAKAVNFGLIYGMSAFGLSKQLNISKEEAHQYIERYFQKYPGVQDYMNRSRLTAKEKGYVETLFGRRLYISDIQAQNMMRRKAAERIAINAPLQGTAADIIKKAMIAIHCWQQDDSPPVRMIMQVHDELVFEVHTNALESCQNKIRHIMEHTVELSVPLVISMGYGKNWDEAH